MAHIAYIGIGSNIGNKIEHCQKAISEILKVKGHKLSAQSSLYKTRPIGYTAQDWFINGVIKIETEMEPVELFRTLKAIESQLGRKETFRWGPRVMDLDLLFYDDTKIQTEELHVPHPHLAERQFVLIPLAEIDRNLVHPVLKKTMGEILDEMKEDQGVERISEIRNM